MIPTTPVPSLEQRETPSAAAAATVSPWQPILSRINSLLQATEFALPQVTESAGSSSAVPIAHLAPVDSGSGCCEVVQDVNVQPRDPTEGVVAQLAPAEKKPEAPAALQSSPSYVACDPVEVVRSPIKESPRVEAMSATSDSSSSGAGALGKSLRDEVARLHAGCILSHTILCTVCTCSEIVCLYACDRF